jgi:hypothetical protein
MQSEKIARADRTKAHSELVAAIRLRLGREQGLTLYLNTKGRLKRIGGASIYVTDPALGVGTSDLVGMLAPRGRWFCLEVKTGDAVLTREQKMFRDLVISMGGFFAEVRSVDDAVTALAQARAGSSGAP